MTIHIYLGPSCPVNEAKKHIDATFYPPIKMGDLFQLVQHTAKKGDVIAIIDGIFEQVPAVWHKEILYALELGFTVYGASSMGALRAAELDSFGMIGFGAVYNDFATNVLEDDDEVAVAHASSEKGFRSLSTAMVSIRHGLSQALIDGIIEQDLHDFLINDAKSTFYSERSWISTLAAGYRKLGKNNHQIQMLKQFIEDQRPDIKRKDAVELLYHLKNHAPKAAKKQTFCMERTAFWQGLTQTIGAPIDEAKESVDSNTASVIEMLNHLRLRPDWTERQYKAVNLMYHSNQLKNIELSKEEEQQQLIIWAQQEKVTSDQQLRQWLAEQQLDTKSFTELLRHQAKLTLLMSSQQQQIMYFVIQSLKFDGQYQAILRQVNGLKDYLKTQGQTKPTLASIGLSEQELQHWYETYFDHGSIRNIVKHYKNLGFTSLKEFLHTVMIEYLWSIRNSDSTKNVSLDMQAD